MFVLNVRQCTRLVEWSHLLGGACTFQELNWIMNMMRVNEKKCCLSNSSSLQLADWNTELNHLDGVVQKFHSGGFCVSGRSLIWISYMYGAWRDTFDMTSHTDKNILWVIRLRNTRIHSIPKYGCSCLYMERVKFAWMRIRMITANNMRAI